MQKYRLMLILPFVLLIIVTWSCLSSEKEEAEKLAAQQNELIADAEEFAADGIYFRAAQKLEEARKLDTGNIDDIEKKLMDYYHADEDYDSWFALGRKRLEAGKSPEEEAVGIIEYCQSNREYGKMREMLNKGLELYPQSEKMLSLLNSLIYSYSYQKFDYEAAAPIFDGDIAVLKDGKWSFASERGSGAKDYIYDSAASFCGEYAAAAAEGKIGLMTSDMKMYSVCHDERVDGVFLYDGNGVVAAAGDKYLLCSKEMEVISEPYDFIGSSSDNMRAAKNGEKWFFINEKGEKALPSEYDDIALDASLYAFFGGTAFVSENGSFKMIDENGEALNAETFEDAYPFIEKDSPAAVKRDGKWGFVNSAGEIVIPCEYDEAKSFSYGLAAVRDGDKWGFINRNGEFVIPAEYVWAEPFKNKRAIVSDGEGCGFIYLEHFE